MLILKPLKLNDKGFTLTEMLVVIVIFILITTIVLVDYRRSERLEILRRSTLYLTSIIRQAQTNALAGFAKQGNQGQRYGVFLYQDSENTLDGYYFFEDNGSHKRFLMSDNEVIIEDHKFPGDVYIQSFLDDGSPNILETLDIIFEPPQPTLYFYPWIFENTAGIVLRQKYNYSYCSLITVSKQTGQINYEMLDYASPICES